MTKGNLSRRVLLKRSAAAGAIGIAGSALPLRFAAAADLTIGILYVGPRDDFGWNQAHAVGAAALKQVPGVTVVEEENVPETVAVQKSMESMINLDGAKLLFPTSFGYYKPHVIAMAKKHPDVQFRHAAPLWNGDTDPKNAGSYFGHLDQGHYVNGVAAGTLTKTRRIGFVAAKPVAPVLRNINSFAMGLKKTAPDAVVQVIFTGEWSLPVREAEATNALVDANCDIITCHVDGPKVVIETAERRGVMTAGHNASQKPLAPNGFITGAEYNWGTIYTDFARRLGAGKPIPNFTVGGYDSDFVKNTDYGAAASAATKAAAEAAKVDLRAGKSIFFGPLKTNDGKDLLAAGTSWKLYEPSLNGTNFLVEGVIGSMT